VAVDAVFDSVSVGTTFRAELKSAGVIFCSFSEAVREFPEHATRRQILLYSVLLVAASLLPLAVGMAGALYAGVAIALGAAFLWYALAVYRHRRDQPAATAARRLFTFSLVYLFAIFAALLAERALPAILGAFIIGGA
jgi:heme O synthase-like polyprenyltransferase